MITDATLEALRLQARALHAQDRLYVQDGANRLHAAQPADVYNAFALDEGTIWVVTARGGRTAQASNASTASTHERSLMGGWRSDTFSHDTYSATSRDVTYTAYPARSTAVFLGVPLQTSDGQALQGVPNVGPIPAGGTVRVAASQESHHVAWGEQHHSGLRDWDCSWYQVAESHSRSGVRSLSE